jgi:hypothetical protein
LSLNLCLRQLALFDVNRIRLTGKRLLPFLVGLHLELSFADSAQKTHASDTSSDFLSSAAGPTSPITVSPTGWMQDLSLMHHFSTRTYNTLSSRQSVSQVWQIDIPLQAAEHPFLMHALLALSASHLSYLRTEEHQRYATLSSHHQNLVLTAFRSIMLDVTAENCTAVFAVAAILSILSLTAISLPVNKQPGHLEASVDDILQSFIFTRGVRDVLRPAWGWIRASPVSVVIEGNILPNYDDFDLPPPIRVRLGDLKHMLETLCDRSVPSALTIALSELEKVFKDILFLNTGTELEMGVIIKWMAAVPSDFILLIRSRNTAALILLAHFVILFDLLKTKWHLHDWSKRSLHAIKSEVSEREWRWLAWPEEQLGSSLPAFQADR